MYPAAATAARGSFRVVTASTKKGKIWTAQGSINRSSSNGSSIRSIRSSSSSRNSSGAHRSGSVRNSSTSCTSNGVGQRAINSCAAWSTHAMPRAARDRVVKRALCTSASGIGSSGGSSGGRGGGARSGGGASSVEFVAAAAAAAAAAVLLSVREFSNHGEEGLCLCKPTVTAEDSIQDYARRLQRLRSLRDIFEEYATVNTDDVGKLMTCGDFLRAMLCYKYVRVGSRELKRRCARYVNPLLGDVHGLISFDEFCFLLSLLSIPAGLFDVAFAAADSDGNGTIDVDELHMLVKRLVPTAGDDDDDDDANENANANTNAGGASAGEKTAEGSDGNPEQQQQQQQRKMKGHRRLAAAWFGEDGTGSVPRERFAAFVRDLRLDVKTVECRLYSSAAIPADEQPGEGPDGAPLAGAPRLWSWWWPPSWLGARGAAAATGDGLSGESGGLAGAAAAGGSGSGSSCGMGGGDEGRDMEGWWSRYEKETISMADLALTLVSTCHPREMPALLTRVQAIRKKRAQIPLRDALLLHEVLEDHAQDLEDALGLYSKASSGGAIGLDEFARAAKIVSGKDLRPECVWLVFKMFDSRGDGRLQHSELREATHDRLRRLPGHNDSPNTFTRFVQCVRGDL